VNDEKSEIEPKRNFRYLGWQWDSEQMTVSLPSDRRKTAKHQAQRLLTAMEAREEIHVRRLASVIGILSATRLQHKQASLFLQQLSHLKTEAVNAHGWNAIVQLGAPTPMVELRWWLRTLATNAPRTLLAPPPEATVTTDAGPTGWGAHVTYYSSGETVVIHGAWSKRAKRKWSSNRKEMTAVVRALARMRATTQGAKISSLLLLSDNTTTVYDINRQRSASTLRLPLLQLLRYLER
jgi:hypothetical protein